MYKLLHGIQGRAMAGIYGIKKTIGAWVLPGIQADAWVEANGIKDPFAIDNNYVLD